MTTARIAMIMLLAVLLYVASGCDLKVYNPETDKWETKRFNNGTGQWDVIDDGTGEGEAGTLISADGTPENTDIAEPDKGDETETPVVEKPPAKTDDKPRHQGWNMAVRIDSKTTTPLRKEGDFQLWTVSACSTTPSIVIMPDPSKLGVIQEDKTSLSIFPLKKGKDDIRNFYRYAGAGKIVPGKEIKLNMLEHIYEDKIRQGVKILPAGKYRFKIRIYGKDSWDQQIIDLEVR
jgi:hypothetical protein